jgi:SAM-dependent methyltransferase
LIIERRPVILDLMASWDSHIPATVEPARVVGLGLNRSELEANPALTEHVVQDLNEEPRLPFEDTTFDVVLNSLSVEYLTRPFEVFREVGRVLKPGGLALVVISDRMFPEKAVNVWRHAGEQERLMIVEDILESSGDLGPSRLWVSKGLPRPGEDRYAGLASFSDPVYAVAAQRLGGARWSRPFPDPPGAGRYSAKEVEERQQRVATTLCCPHCDHALVRWDVPQTPFTEWQGDHVYICPSNQCPYAVRGWQAMSRQGNPGSSYRFMYDPDRDRCSPIPIGTLGDLSTPEAEEARP